MHYAKKSFFMVYAGHMTGMKIRVSTKKMIVKFN